MDRPRACPLPRPATMSCIGQTRGLSLQVVWQFFVFVGFGHVSPHCYIFLGYILPCCQSVGTGTGPVSSSILPSCLVSDRHSVCSYRLIGVCLFWGLGHVGGLTSLLDERYCCCRFPFSTDWCVRNGRKLSAVFAACTPLPYFPADVPAADFVPVKENAAGHSRPLHGMVEIGMGGPAVSCWEQQNSLFAIRNHAVDYFRADKYRCV